MAFAAMFATLIGRLFAGMVVAACVGLALIVAGVRWLAEAAADPPPLDDDIHEYDVDDDGAWRPVHGPRGQCWPCHHGSKA